MQVIYMIFVCLLLLMQPVAAQQQENSRTQNNNNKVTDITAPAADVTEQGALSSSLSSAAAADQHAVPSLPVLEIKTRNGQVVRFHVEVVDTPESRAKGMMFRQAMPEDQGMFFIFEDSRRRSFWMKNTLIPLDIIFIDKNGVIRHIHHDAVPQDETPIPSRADILTVLEINGGQAAEKGIHVGDRIFHEIF